MRKAGQRIKEAYRSNEIAQDILETLVATGISTGVLALSGLTPEELLVTSALTAGAGFVGRPIGGKIGAAAGRLLDKSAPDVAEQFNIGYGKYRDISKNVSLRPGMADQKYALNTKDRGPAEGTLNHLGKMYGDNLIQAIMTLAFLPKSDSKTEDIK